MNNTNIEKEVNMFKKMKRRQLKTKTNTVEVHKFTWRKKIWIKLTNNIEKVVGKCIKYFVNVSRQRNKGKSMEFKTFCDITVYSE